MPPKVILGKLNQQNKQIKPRNSTLHSVNPGTCTPLCDAYCPLMLCSGADASLQWEPLYIRPYASASFVCTRNVVCCALGDSLRAESHSQLKTRSCSSPPKPTYPSQHCLHLHVASFVQAHFTVDTFRARHDVPPCRADLPPQAKLFSSAAAALLLSNMSFLTATEARSWLARLLHCLESLHTFRNRGFELVCVPRRWLISNRVGGMHTGTSVKQCLAVAANTPVGFGIATFQESRWHCACHAVSRSWSPRCRGSVSNGALRAQTARRAVARCCCCTLLQNTA